MTEETRPPVRFKFADPMIVASQRRGVVIGTMRLLCVPGVSGGGGWSMI